MGSRCRVKTRLRRAAELSVPVFLLAVLLSACGASKVVLPMNLAEQVKAAAPNLRRSPADLVLVMSGEDAGMRYMAHVNDLKLQLDIGEAYRKNLRDVMALLFTTVRDGADVGERGKAGGGNAYALEASFRLVRVTIPVTRFGKTQAHIVMRYVLYDPQGKKAFTFTDYAYGARSNIETLKNLMKHGGFIFGTGEAGVAGSAMEYNIKSGIMAIASLVEQYLDGQMRAPMLTAVQAHEQDMSAASQKYAVRLRSGDYPEKGKAAKELRTDLGSLALVQGVMLEELLSLSKNGLSAQGASDAAREMCKTLAMTGNSNVMRTLQRIAHTAKNDQLQRWCMKASEDIHYSLCGTSACESKSRQG